MAIMKKLLNEYHEVSTGTEPLTYHQSQCHHHSAKAMECGRASRHHDLMANNAKSPSNSDTGKVHEDNISDQHQELAEAYGTAAKAHLALADHHSAEFKKERTDTVKQMTKPIKNPLGKDGVR